MSNLRLVVCRGRHPVNITHDGYVFPKDVVNPMDFDALYKQVESQIPEATSSVELIVTGLTPCVLAVVKYCMDHKVQLTCLHYDRETGEYKPQIVL